MLHVERRAVLGLTLGLRRVQAAVHATVAILSKEGVDGLYSGLGVEGKKLVRLEKVKKYIENEEGKLTKIGFP